MEKELLPKVAHYDMMADPFRCDFSKHLTVGQLGNALLNAAGTDLSDDAMKLIAGLMELAPAITAFGNTNPTSYFRLVPHQEAPTNVCWGKRNRSVLVRVPLGWTANTDMSAIANPQSAGAGDCVTSQRQTIEIRSADGSAHVQMLMAALAVACLLYTSPSPRDA